MRLILSQLIVTGKTHVAVLISDIQSVVNKILETFLVMTLNAEISDTKSVCHTNPVGNEQVFSEEDLGLWMNCSNPGRCLPSPTSLLN